MADIEKQITAALRDYSEGVVEQINKDAESCAKGLVKDIRASSPKGRSGRYAKGWRVKKSLTSDFWNPSYIVHNATDYQLAHLLEKGHKGPHGSNRSTPAKVHIKPAEEKWTEEFYNRCEEAVKK